MNELLLLVSWLAMMPVLSPGLAQVLSVKLLRVSTTGTAVVMVDWGPLNAAYGVCRPPMESTGQVTPDAVAGYFLAASALGAVVLPVCSASFHWAAGRVTLPMNTGVESTPVTVGPVAPIGAVPRPLKAKSCWVVSRA